MGFFQGVLNFLPAGQNAQKAQRKAARAAINERIYGIERAQNFRKTEDPREQAALKQGMFARGLGKSTIHDQDRDRLAAIQKMRNDTLSGAHHVAIRQRQAIKKGIAYQRRSNYMAMLDNILALAGGIGGGSTSGAPSGTGGVGGEGGGGGMLGDFQYGGFA